MDTAGCGFSNC